jgi:hypothetical protein
MKYHFIQGEGNPITVFDPAFFNRRLFSSKQLKSTRRSLHCPNNIFFVFSIFFEILLLFWDTYVTLKNFKYHKIFKLIKLLLY